MTIWYYTMISVFLVSVISLVGLASLTLSGRFLKVVVFVSVGFAAGALYGDAFIHLIPESFSSLQGQTPLYVLLGILVFFSLEKFLRWRHVHAQKACEPIEPVGYLNLVADGVHNFIDGMLIGSSYLISIPLGLANHDCRGPT